MLDTIAAVAVKLDKRKLANMKQKTIKSYFKIFFYEMIAGPFEGITGKVNKNKVNFSLHKTLALRSFATRARKNFTSIIVFQGKNV